MSEPSEPHQRVDAPASGAERAVGWVSGVFTMGLVGSVIGTYVYGSSQPEEHEVLAYVDVPVSVDEAYALLSDMEARPGWRPRVERIGRIHDDETGREVWRELDHGGDRFDIKVMERTPPREVVFATASPEQIGYDAVWTWSLQAEDGGSRVALREVGVIDNPLWRGVFYLRSHPEETVLDELTLFSAHFGGGAPWVP